MNIAIIGLRAFPSHIQGISGIDVRGEALIRELKKRNKINVYVRSWIHVVAKRNVMRNVVVTSVPTIKNKYIDTPLYSLIASILVCFSDSEIIFYEATSSTLFSFLPKLFKKKVVVTVHTIEYERTKWGVLASLVLHVCEIVGMKVSDTVVCVSDNIENRIRRKYKKDSVIIPYYFSLQKIKRKATGNYILYLGRFTKEKRVEWLIDAYNQVKPKGMKLVLAGGNILDKGYESRIEDLVKDNPNIVRVGYVFGKDKEKLLSNAALCVFPSSIEGSPLSLLEALSYRRRVLVSAVGGLDTLFNNNSYYFESTSYPEFVSKFKTLVDNKGTTIRLSDLNMHSFISRKEFFRRYRSVLKNSLPEE